MHAFRILACVFDHNSAVRECRQGADLSDSHMMNVEGLPYGAALDETLTKEMSYMMVLIDEYTRESAVIWNWSRLCDT